MEIKDKIRSIYKEYDINISNKSILRILEDKERIKRIMKWYQQKEMNI